MSDLKPGQDLDRLVAEKVMGWTELEERTLTHITGTQVVGAKPGEIPSKHTGHIQKYVIPSYSTDIAAAWQVVEKLRSKEQITIASDYHGKWLCSNNHEDYWSGQDSCDLDNKFVVYGETAPHAICLAALKAVEKHD